MMASSSSPWDHASCADEVIVSRAMSITGKTRDSCSQATADNLPGRACVRSNLRFDSGTVVPTMSAEGAALT